jgi:hypothetical protein
MDAGHFRHLDALDFDEHNVHVQCDRCNRRLSGNRGKYAIFIVRKYGLEVAEGLESYRPEGKKALNMTELFAIREKYKKALSEL